MQDRGQTNLDFAIGVSILLVTIIAAMTFVPGLFQTVDQGRSDADEVAASRFASILVEEKLADPGKPGQLDADCVRDFYNSSKEDPDGRCNLDGSVPVQNLPVRDRRNVNVTVVNATGGTMCWDFDAATVAHEWGAGPGNCDDGNDEVFTAGATPTGSSDVAVARRGVTIEGLRASVVVRVW